MPLNVQQVPIEYVNQVWPQVEGYIEQALGYSCGDYSTEEAKVMVTTGMWSLIVAVTPENAIQGAAIVSYFNRPNARVGFVIAIGGRLISNKDTWEQFQSILRANGATYLEGAGRDSIVRLWARYGMEKKYTIIGKEL